MKYKFTLVLLLNLFSFSLVKSQITIPQLQAGVPINDTIHTFLYSFAGYCGTLPTHDVNIVMDAGLIPIATGVELYYLVSQLTTPPGSVMSSQAGILNVGDTLKFPNSSNNQFTFYAAATGIMVLELIISGIPSVPFQNYPCEINTFCTLADCNNTCMSISNAPSTCVVDNFSAMNSLSNRPDVNVHPDPTCTFLQINNLNFTGNNLLFEVHDALGRTVLAEIITHNNTNYVFPIHSLENGIYFWKITGQNQQLQIGKFLVQKNNTRI